MDGRQLDRGALSATALAATGKLLAEIHLAGRTVNRPTLPTRHKPSILCPKPN